MFSYISHLFHIIHTFFFSFFYRQPQQQLPPPSITHQPSPPPPPTYIHKYNEKYNALISTYTLSENDLSTIQTETNKHTQQLITKLTEELEKYKTEQNRWSKLPNSEPLKHCDRHIKRLESQLHIDNRQTIESFFSKKILHDVLHTHPTVTRLCHCVLLENTPRGNIVMYYCSQKRAFIYYSDCSTIAFNILESTSKKYAIQFNCKYIMANEPTSITKENKYIRIGKLMDYKWLSNQYVSTKAIHNISFSEFKRLKKL